MCQVSVAKAGKEVDCGQQIPLSVWLYKVLLRPQFSAEEIVQ